MKKYLRRLFGTAIGLAALVSAPAIAETQFGVGVRGGSLGLGADLDFAFTDNLNARVGYAGYSINRTVDQTNLTYAGKLKLSNPSVLLDWRVLAGLRMTLGAVLTSTKIDAIGRPTAGTFTIGGNTYSSSEVGSVTGSFKMGNSVAPYIGFGWGNVVGRGGHFSFLFDVGAIYAGTPSVALTANCTSNNAAVCSQLQSDVAVERKNLEKNVTLLKWYPVVGVGFGYGF
jgi:hypothetical protein